MSLVGGTVAVMPSNMQKAWYVKTLFIGSGRLEIIFKYLNPGQPEPLKRRSIMCVDQNEMALPDTRCTNETKPNDSGKCSANLPYCDADDNENNMI